MSSYEERKQARIERYRVLAEKAQQESETIWAEADRMASVIPFGQPLLVGHYSYNRDKRYRERIAKKMDKVIETMDKAAYYESKAEAAENDRAISSDDPEAIAKLKEKLKDLQESQTYMKTINAFYRKHGTCHGCEGVSDELADKLEGTIAKEYSLEKVPFPSYALSLNNKEIHRIGDRIRLLERDRAIGFAGWEFKGGRAEPNTEENRLQLFFDERPPEEQRKALRAHGFNWSSYHKAWQRKLNMQAIYAADDMPFVRPPNGSVIKLQSVRAAESLAQEAPEEDAPGAEAPSPDIENPREDHVQPEREYMSRADRVQSVLEQLRIATPSIFTPENLPFYLDRMARFPSYSYNNVLLIALQRPTATQVAGAKTWRALGRHIREGEVGIHILAPVPIKGERQGQAQTETDQEVVKTLFRVVSVFDVSQTEGRDPPEQYAGLLPAEYPTFLSAIEQPEAADMAEAVHAAVLSKLKSSGAPTWTVGTEPEYVMEAQCAAYVLSKYYGLDASLPSDVLSQYHFHELEHYKESLDSISSAVSQFIEQVDARLYGRTKARAKAAPSRNRRGQDQNVRRR